VENNKYVLGQAIKKTYLKHPNRTHGILDPILGWFVFSFYYGLSYIAQWQNERLNRRNLFADDLGCQI